jgi:hypothetical protein
MKGNILKIAVFLFLMTCVYPFASQAATQRYYANFDSQSIPQPWLGTISIFQQFSVWEIGSERYTFQPGRGGPGYALTDKTEMYGGSRDWRSTSIEWDVFGTWPTDEIYVSWWERYQEPFSPLNQNTKLFYLYFDPSNLTDRNRMSIERKYNDAGAYGARGAFLDKNGAYIAPDGEDGWYAPLPNMLDGNWNHFEAYINFTGYTIKIWYNGVQKLNKTYDPSLINWNRHIYWMFFFGPWTTCCPQVDSSFNFTRQIDDFEVWDGMPGSFPIIDDGRGSNMIPNSPTQLKIE